MFASCGQEAFFEGHVHAFTVLGGLPTGMVRYDNLRSAVRQVLGFSRARVENERWVAFRSHFGLDAFYCQPGTQDNSQRLLRWFIDAPETPSDRRDAAGPVSDRQQLVGEGEVRGPPGLGEGVAAFALDLVDDVRDASVLQVSSVSSSNAFRSVKYP